MTDSNERASHQTALDEPIKIRWTGYLRGRIAERHGGYVHSDDNPSNDESTRSVDRVLTRQKTNVVIETVEEAEYFIAEIEWYAMGTVHWMNGPMRNAAQRVANETREQLKAREIDE